MNSYFLTPSFIQKAPGFLARSFFHNEKNLLRSQRYVRLLCEDRNEASSPLC